VRFQASYEGSIAAFAFDSDPAVAAPFLEALQAESDPLVLANMLKNGVTGARKSPALRTFLLASIDHASPHVREVSARLLGDAEVLPEVPEAFERLAAKAQSDPDGHVRATACSALGAMQDDRAMPVFKAMLEGPSTPDEVRNGCFEGVVKSWAGFPYPKRPRRDAYEYTLELLSKKPRGPKTPWRGVARLGWAKSEVKPIDREGAAWLSNVRGFFDAKQVVAVLEDLVLDADAPLMARSEAIFVLRRQNEQELLKALARGLEKQKGPDAKTLATRAKSLSQQASD
jgi:HEAT repeat protein